MPHLHSGAVLPHGSVRVLFEHFLLRVSEQLEPGWIEVCSAVICTCKTSVRVKAFKRFQRKIITTLSQG